MSASSPASNTHSEVCCLSVLTCLGIAADMHLQPTQPRSKLRSVRARRSSTQLAWRMATATHLQPTRRRSKQFHFACLLCALPRSVFSLTTKMLWQRQMCDHHFPCAFCAFPGRPTFFLNIERALGQRRLLQLRLPDTATLLPHTVEVLPRAVTQR